ncbi:hypothetical protein FRC16_004346 [Serendipita sp. 398]|nr:hypothetical protein FRC16_004346 [Serendipita sp. 398]
MHSLLTSFAGALFLTSTSLVSAAPALQRRDPTWLPAQGGCWSDNTNGQRALDKNLGGFDDLTPAKCQSLCDAQGFNLAGVEFGRECFCGNTVFGNNRPTSASVCSITCSGDVGQTCGGPNGIYIYVKNSYPFTVGPASVLDAYNGYQNPSCWQDSVNNRIFSGRPSTDIPADQMTVQKCIDGCAAAGFSAAGLEFGRECFCGNASTPPAESAPQNECDMPCLGDASRYCGGSNRLLTYHKPANNVPQPNPGPASPAPPASSVPPVPATKTYKGVIQVLTADTNLVVGYLNKDTQVGISKYSLDPTNREQFTFTAPTGQTISRAEITAVDMIDGYPFLGLIEGYANSDSYIGPGNWQYLFVGGVSHSAPGATPQTGANSYFISARQYESSVWTINSATGDITPQWINPDGSKPTTYLMGWYGYIGFGSGDPAQTNAHFGHNDVTIKFKFIPNP